MPSIDDRTRRYAEAIDDDERRARYGEAIGWRDDGSTPGAIRAMLREQTARVMAVADAEQVELRAEVARQAAFIAAIDSHALDGDDVPSYLGSRVLEVEAKVARVEAAIRAVLQADDEHVTYEPCGGCVESGVALVAAESAAAMDAALDELRAALEDQP